MADASQWIEVREGTFQAESTGPHGQRTVERKHNGLYTIEKIEAFPDGTVRQIYLPLSPKPDQDYLDHLLAKVQQEAKRIRDNRLIITGAQGAIDVRFANMVSPKSIITRLADEVLHDRSASSDWNTPLGDPTTVYLTEGYGPNQEPRNYFMMFRYDGGQLVDCKIDTKTEYPPEIDHKTRRLGSLPLTLLSTIDAADETEDIGGYTFAVDEMYKEALGVLGLTESDLVVAAANNAALVLMNKFLAENLPDIDQEEALAKLQKTDFQWNLSQRILLHSRRMQQIFKRDRIKRKKIPLNEEEIYKAFAIPGHEPNPEGMRFLEAEGAKFRTEDVIRNTIIETIEGIRSVIRTSRVLYLSNFTAQSASWSEYDLTETTRMRDERRLVSEGNIDYPHTFNASGNTVTLAKEGESLIITFRASDEEKWTAKILLRISGKQAKEIFDDPGADFREIKNLLNINF